MNAGAVEFLAKPFRDQDLLDAIHQAIERDHCGISDCFHFDSSFPQLSFRVTTSSCSSRVVVDCAKFGFKSGTGVPPSFLLTERRAGRPSYCANRQPMRSAEQFKVSAGDGRPVASPHNE
jgi:hypothetical protein